MKIDVQRKKMVNLAHCKDFMLYLTNIFPKIIIVVFYKTFCVSLHYNKQIFTYAEASKKYKRN